MVDCMQFNAIEPAEDEDDDCMVVGVSNPVTCRLDSKAAQSREQRHEEKNSEIIQQALVAAERNMKETFPHWAELTMKIRSDVMLAYIVAQPEFMHVQKRNDPWLKVIMLHLTINQCKENQEDEDEAKFARIKESLRQEPENVSDEDSEDAQSITNIVVPWDSVPPYQIKNVRNLRALMVKRALEAGKNPVELGLVETLELQSKSAGEGGVPVDEGDDWEGGDGVEAPDFRYISADVWKEGRVPLAMAVCKDDDMCLLCILCGNRESCRFSRRSISWFYLAYQAMIVLVSYTPALLEMVKASQQHKVLQAIECSCFLRTALKINICRICPRYLRLWANNLLEQLQGKLQIMDVKTLFNVAMITLDEQAHQMELKQEQLSFLNAVDAPESGSRVGSKGSTELECKVIAVAETAKKGKGLFAVCDIHSGDFVCEYWGLPSTLVDDGIACMVLSDKLYINPVNSMCICQYVNHQCKMASCVWKEIDSTTGLEMWLQAQRDIKQGEELTVHYGMLRHLMLAAFGTPCFCVHCIKHT
eukprot:2359030-Rhodomonas_salina.1